MAKNKSTVYLGYEDEEITDKYRGQLNYTVNKVGGTPDWSHCGISVPNCPICSLSRPLILQIYAPLENSQFHRTLYVFACVNSTCSSLSKSWMCIRTQVLDKTQECEANKSGKTSLNKVSWCSGADDWDDGVENHNEENGNVIRNDNRVSDDDDDSNSMENDIVGGFVNLNVDDKNANCGAQGGAVAAFTSSNIYAEIEGDESEVVTVETPLAPERDLIALLKQTPSISQNAKNFVLKSFFIAVEEENLKAGNQPELSDHERELLQEYQMHDELSRSNPDYPESGVSSSVGDWDQESYEKAVPAHGDVMFHNFLSTIQHCPGQILRYSRDNFPLLITPLHEQIPKCQNCGGDCICEVQILPTIIPKLQMANGDPAPMEFGNVLIFTCIQSCWDTPDKMRFEHIIVQQEV